MEKDEGGYSSFVPWPMVSNYGLLIQRQGGGAGNLGLSKRQEDKSTFYVIKINEKTQFTEFPPTEKPSTFQKSYL